MSHPATSSECCKYEVMAFAAAVYSCLFKSLLDITFFYLASVDCNLSNARFEK